MRVWASRQRSRRGPSVASFAPIAVRFSPRSLGAAISGAKSTLRAPRQCRCSSALATLDPELRLRRIDHRRRRRRTITRRASTHAHAAADRHGPAPLSISGPALISAPTPISPRHTPSPPGAISPPAISPHRTHTISPRAGGSPPPVTLTAPRFGRGGRLDQRPSLPPRQRRRGRRQARPGDDQPHHGDHENRPRHVPPAHAAQHV
jgi:hypothetical protein